MGRRPLAYVGAALLLTIVSQCIADESKPGPDYERLKPMEWMIGDWEAEWVVPPGGFSSPDGYPAGAKVRSTGSNFWMQRKNYIGYRFKDEIDGKIVHQGFEMIGVDPHSKKIIHWLFSILGGWGTGEWSRDGKTWTLKWSGTAADGAKYEGTADIVQVDANTQTVRMRDTKKNGKETPSSPTITFRRVNKTS